MWNVSELELREWFSPLLNSCVGLLVGLTCYLCSERWNSEFSQQDWHIMQSRLPRMGSMCLWSPGTSPKEKHPFLVHPTPTQVHDVHPNSSKWVLAGTRALALCSSLWNAGQGLLGGTQAGLVLGLRLTFHSGWKWAAAWWRRDFSIWHLQMRAYTPSSTLLGSLFFLGKYFLTLLSSFPSSLPP